MTETTARLTFAISGPVPSEEWIQRVVLEHTIDDILDLRMVRAKAYASRHHIPVSTHDGLATDEFRALLDERGECQLGLVRGPEYMEIEDDEDWVLVLVLEGRSSALLELVDIARDVPSSIKAVITDPLTPEGSELGIGFFGGDSRALRPAECENVLRAALPLLAWP